MALLTEIERSILRTICYFDLFEFPLTVKELHANIIGRKLSYQAILNGLHNLKTLAQSDEGFYFLPGKEKFVQLRKEKYLLADRKFRIALRNANLIRRMPYVKAIFVVNKLAYSNSKEHGDIDFVVITKKNKIWTARFYSALLMKLLNRRPKKNNQKNKICLSFFLAEDNLHLKKYAYENDIHFAMWISQFVPVFDPDELYLKFYEENTWVKELIPNWMVQETNDKRSIRNKSVFQRVGQWKVFWQERILRKLQMRVLPKQLKALEKEDNSNVILEDNVLKMHLKDVRLEVLEKWEESCKKNVGTFQVSDFFNVIKSNK